MDDRAQISVEMLLIAAAVLAIAFIIIQSLNSTAGTAVNKLNSTSNKLLDEIGNLK